MANRLLTGFAFIDPGKSTGALAARVVGMMEAAKGFRRLNAHKQLPILRAALLAHQARHTITANLEQQAKAA